MGAFSPLLRRHREDLTAPGSIRPHRRTEASAQGSPGRAGGGLCQLQVRTSVECSFAKATQLSGTPVPHLGSQLFALEADRCAQVYPLRETGPGLDS